MTSSSWCVRVTWRRAFSSSCTNRQTASSSSSRWTRAGRRTVNRWWVRNTIKNHGAKHTENAKIEDLVVPWQFSMTKVGGAIKHSLRLPRSLSGNSCSIYLTLVPCKILVQKSLAIRSILCLSMSWLLVLSGHQGSFLCVQPMRGDVTMYLRLSLSQSIHKMIPGSSAAMIMVIQWNLC